MSSIRTTSRLILAYAQTGFEEWKSDHDLAMVCRDVEEAITWGIQLFRGLTKIEAGLQAEVCRSQLSEAQYGPLYASIANDYQRLFETFEKILETEEKLGRFGYALDGVEEFHEVAEEARCVVDSMELESKVRPIEELIPWAKPDNPRPERYGD